MVVMDRFFFFHPVTYFVNTGYVANSKGLRDGGQLEKTKRCIAVKLD